MNGSYSVVSHANGFTIQDSNGTVIKRFNDGEFNNTERAHVTEGDLQASLEKAKWLVSLHDPLYQDNMAKTRYLQAKDSAYSLLDRHDKQMGS